MKGTKIFYSLVTGSETLRLMKDILRQNQFSAIGPKGTTRPDCPQPAILVSTPVMPMASGSHFSPARDTRPGWSYTEISIPASCMGLKPMRQPCLQPCLCPHPFLLQTGPPGWTLTVVHWLLCLGPVMDLDTSRPCHTAPIGKRTEEDPSFSSLMDKPSLSLVPDTLGIKQLKDDIKQPLSNVK